MSIFLVYLFVHRLFKLVAMIPLHENAYTQREQDHFDSFMVQATSKDSNKSKFIATADLGDLFEPSVDSVFNPKQDTIIYVASKYAVLSFIAILSTQIFLISAALNAVSGDFYKLSFGVYFSLLALDCFISAMCICLNFDFNQLWYWRLCCLCDECCYSLCLCLSKRRRHNLQ